MEGRKPRPEDLGSPAEAPEGGAVRLLGFKGFQGPFKVLSSLLRVSASKGFKVLLKYLKSTLKVQQKYLKSTLKVFYIP